MQNVPFYFIHLNIEIQLIHVLCNRKLLLLKTKLCKPSPCVNEQQLQRVRVLGEGDVGFPCHFMCVTVLT